LNQLLFDGLLLAWPDQLPSQRDLAGNPLGLAARAMRLNQHHHAEVLLLSALTGSGRNQITPDLNEGLALLAHQMLIREQVGSEFFLLVQQIVANDSESARSRYLQAQLLLLQSDIAALQALPCAFWQADDDGAQLLRLAQIAFWIRSGDHSKAQQALADQALASTLEGHRLLARLLAAERKFAEAVEQLEHAVQRAPSHLALQAHYVKCIFDARDGNRAIPALRQATSVHGDAPGFLGSITAVKLLQRQPGMARRAALIERAVSSVRPIDPSVSNLLIGYEHSGHSDWMPYLCPAVAQAPVSQFDLHSNLILQLSSCESPQVRPKTEEFLQALLTIPVIRNDCATGSAWAAPRRTASEHLRIAWLTPDLHNHPVGRFLHGFFAASGDRLQHRHLLVSLQGGGSHSWKHHFERLPGLEVVDLAAVPEHQRVSPVRELQADIAIDLSGWTANHFMVGFLARVAPLQISYLGYHATTGLPSMDVWLGDQQLFPQPMVEWHSERIHRLERCFIAWQPSPVLPEAAACIDPAPPGSVRFGCFNHLRKVSDAALRVWGTLLAAVPEARLVLKAHAQDDAATQELLRRRLLRAGIEPERIQWLPFTATPEQHLRQYRHIDIALDPFPNGGCTTTCEALWMGVPTVALCGRHYVSRMSTAVLHGAGLPEWVAPTTQAYVELACEQAAGLAQLRQGRDRWRTQLQGSPLGDAADLMRHLEQAFATLHREQLSRQAAAG